MRTRDLDPEILLRMAELADMSASDKIERGGLYTRDSVLIETEGWIGELRADDLITYLRNHRVSNEVIFYHTHVGDTFIPSPPDLKAAAMMEEYARITTGVGLTRDYYTGIIFVQPERISFNKFVRSGDFYEYWEIVEREDYMSALEFLAKIFRVSVAVKIEGEIIHLLGREAVDSCPPELLGW